MTFFNKKRLPVKTFKMTDDIVKKLREGWYSDEYFNNTLRVLKKGSDEKKVFGDYFNILENIVSVKNEVYGDIYVQMQFFTRRIPFSVVAGVDEALAILEVATGYYENGEFINTYDDLEIEAVHDGTIAHYNGNPMEVEPVLVIRGRYRDFGHLETPILGALSLPTRIATNTYNVLEAANGKSVLFFPARFDHYKIQAVGGYAYRVALERFNHEHNKDVDAAFSTNEQNDWWGYGRAKGTISHSTIACFYGNTAAAMLAFAETIPTETPRIALVDFHNDCVNTTYEVIDLMWEKYFECIKKGKKEEAKKYILFGVRPDTSGNMVDESLKEVDSNEHGVNIELVSLLRKSIDSHYKTLVEKMNGEEKEKYTELAKEYCERIKITVTGGFNVKKINAFEKANAPVDAYGVGSSLLFNSSADGTNNDFTADVVKVKVDGKYYDLSKKGRRHCENKNLIKVK